MTGTLLQLAAMAGDVDLTPEIVDENERGLVERLAASGNLSKEGVAKELEFITSQKAIDENEARIQRYLAIIKKFGNSLCEGKVANADAFAQFKKELLEERRKAVNAGFILK